MKKILFTVAALASITTFATKVTGPSYRLEGELGFPVKIEKSETEVAPDETHTEKIDGKYYDKKDVENGKPKKDAKGLDGKVEYGKVGAFQKGTDLQMNFMPEWKYEINDKVDVVFGPKISVGDKMLTQYKLNGYEFDSAHGLFATAGGEVNFDFALPKGEKVFIGLGLRAGGQGVIDFSDGISKTEVLGSGHIVNVDFLIGGKISEKIKLALNLGYENAGLKVRSDKLGVKKDSYDISHSFCPGLTFGYIIGK